jgi:hypothetical protein
MKIQNIDHSVDDLWENGRSTGFPGRMAKTFPFMEGNADELISCCFITENLR